MTVHRKWGWKRSLPDQNHKKFGLTFKDQIALPAKFNLTSQMSPVDDQGQLGSCVANATAGALEFLELQGIRTQTDLPEEFGPTFDPLSRLFIYYYARYIDGDTSEDNGTTMSSAVAALKQFGVCRESVWPYDVNAYSQKPICAAVKEAVSHQVMADYKIDNTDLNQMLSCLAMGYPFVFGISVYDSFMNATNGAIPMPGSDEQVQGGHALCCVGYDQESKVFLFRNSWGADWGDAGYGTIPFDYLTSDSLCDDVWTIRQK